MTPRPSRSRSLFEWPLLNLSIPWKLALMISVLSMALAGSLAISFIGMDILSAARAYVGGESRWSRAQKQAVYRLGRYALLRNEEDYNQFLDYLTIPEGDRRAREEMDKPVYDKAVVRSGFSQGGNHPDDLAGMMRLYRNFRHVSFMADAIRIWTEGDQHIARLRETGDAMHRQIRPGRATPRSINLLLMQADEINDRLTPLEEAFSSTLATAARKVKKIVILALLIASLAFWLIGLSLAFLIARHLTTQIGRLRDAAARVAGGDYSQPITLSTRDEVGDLSMAFQRMMQQRQRAEGEITNLNDQLEHRVTELRGANTELDAFCYSISHDLRAPLRAIDGFAGILQTEHTAQLGPEGRKLVEALRRNAGQMSELIEGLLTFSRLSLQPLETSEIDLTQLALEVVDELRAFDKKHSLDVSIAPLGRATGDRKLLRQVFINLLGNALKFTREKFPARVEVGVAGPAGTPAYFVKDNGVGFDMRYADKLFGVFQRLHSDKEFEGTGVGLALVQRIVIRHGGKIWAEAKPGEGACFFFTLHTLAEKGLEKGQ